MWKKILKGHSDIIKYPNLTSLLNAIRALPHSNADPERTFSILSDLKTKKRNLLSSTTVNAICVLKSALKTRKETSLSMEITADHISLMTTDKLYKLPQGKKKSCIKLYAGDVDTAGPSSV